MCTFNIALDDQLVNTARSSFLNAEEMTAWMEEQITILLRNHTMPFEEKPIRKARKHDALMGIISMDAEKDYKRIHLRKKYGV